MNNTSYTPASLPLKGKDAPLRRLYRGLSSMKCFSVSSKNLLKSSSHIPGKEENTSPKIAEDDLTKATSTRKVNRQLQAPDKEFAKEIAVPALLPSKKSISPPPPSAGNKNRTLEQVFEEYDRIIAMNASSSSLYCSDLADAENKCEKPSDSTGSSASSDTSKSLTASGARLAATSSPISSPKLQRKLETRRGGLSRFCSTSNLFQGTKQAKKVDKIPRQSSMRILAYKPLSGRAFPPSKQKGKPISLLVNSLGSRSHSSSPSSKTEGLVAPEATVNSLRQPNTQKLTRRENPSRGIGRFCSMSYLMKGSGSGKSHLLTSKKMKINATSIQVSEEKQGTTSRERREKQPPKRTKSFDSFALSYEEIVEPGFQPVIAGETLTGW